MAEKVAVNRNAKVMVVEKGQLSFIGEYTVKNEIVCITNPRMPMFVQDPGEGKTTQKRVMFVPLPYSPVEVFVRDPDVWYKPEQAMIDAYFENVTGIAVVRTPLVNPNGELM